MELAKSKASWRIFLSISSISPGELTNFVTRVKDHGRTGKIDITGKGYAYEKKIRLFLVALLVLSTFSVSAFKDGSIAETPYIYPILPGDDVWNTLDTKQERLYLLQIPESVLDSLTTQELLELVLLLP